MKSNRLVNGLAVVGALIVILGVGSAANKAFAAPSDAGLKFATQTTVNR